MEYLLKTTIGDQKRGQHIYIKFSLPPFLGHVISLEHNVCNERLDQVEGNLHVAIIEVIL